MPGAAVDDEDGVNFLTPLVPGQPAQVEVVASVDGWLNAWIDFDRDGVWSAGPTENVFFAQPLNAGVNLLSFMVPASAQPGPNEPTYSRWRFSTTDRVLQPYQADEPVPDGEVEDHLVFIQERDPDPQPRLDFGDAPDTPYPTLLAHNGARHLVDPNVHLGKRIEAEPDGQPTLASDGDDQNVAAMVDDEDGVTFLTPLVPGQPAQVEVEASVDGWLNAWIDFDRNGVWTSGGAENIFVGQPLNAGVNVLSFMVPNSAQPGPNEPTYSRWRFSTTDKILRPSQAGQPLPDGEVEDHLAFIQERDPDPQVRLDYGDAPDTPYPTLLVNDGARHVIDPEIRLGERIEEDPNGQPHFLALGDDLVDGTDDEDGVRFLTPLVPGQDAKVEVLPSIDGFVDAWIDFDQDGKWAASEQIAISQFVVAGSDTISFVVPRDAIPHPTRPVYSRFRFSTTGGLGPTGFAKNGEVEDYALLNGDLNEDGKIDDQDIDRLCHLLHAGDAAADLNGDGSVDEADMDYLIRDILGTDYGDANLDGLFNSADLVQIFAGGQYNDGIPHNSGWANGDFNCDGDFDSADLVKAMQTGKYSAAAIPQPRRLSWEDQLVNGLFGDELESFATVRRRAERAVDEVFALV